VHVLGTWYIEFMHEIGKRAGGEAWNKNKREDHIFLLGDLKICFKNILKHFIQHCFICRLLDSTRSKDAGIEADH
jgi:hypothetical protein